MYIECYDYLSKNIDERNCLSGDRTVFRMDIVMKNRHYCMNNGPIILHCETVLIVLLCVCYIVSL